MAIVDKFLSVFEIIDKIHNWPWYLSIPVIIIVLIVVIIYVFVYKKKYLNFFSSKKHNYTWYEWEQLSKEEVEKRLVYHDSIQNNAPGIKDLAAKINKYFRYLPNDYVQKLNRRSIKVEIIFGWLFADIMWKNDNVLQNIIIRLPYLFSSNQLNVDLILILDLNRSAFCTGDFIRTRAQIGRTYFAEEVRKNFSSNSGDKPILEWVDECSMTHDKQDLINTINQHNSILILEPIAIPKEDFFTEILKLVSANNQNKFHCISLIFLGDKKCIDRHKKIADDNNCEIQVISSFNYWNK
jgi:hypothetical protein